MRSLLLLFAALTLTAAAGAASGWQPLAGLSASASAEKAVAGGYARSAIDSSLVRPGRIAVRVSASPRQRVQVRWSTSCESKGGWLRRAGQLTRSSGRGNDPLLELKFARDQRSRCSVHAEFAASRAGTVQMQLYARDQRG